MSLNSDICKLWLILWCFCSYVLYASFMVYLFYLILGMLARKKKHRAKLTRSTCTIYLTLSQVKSIFKRLELFLLMIYSVERNIYSGKERNESITSINDKVLNVWMKYFFYLIKILETLSSNSDKTNDIYSEDL